ncbi:unnamed protein product, partial [Sphagnum compactum]
VDNTYLYIKGFLILFKSLPHPLIFSILAPSALVSRVSSLGLVVVVVVVVVVPEAAVFQISIPPVLLRGEETSPRSGSRLCRERERERASRDRGREVASGAPQHHQQQQQQQQNAQQQMVQQLGLGSAPDSPDAPSPASYNNKQIPQPLAARDVVDDEDIEDDGRGTSGNRWPRQETLALIKIRSEMDAHFRDSGLKGPLWEDVSRKLADLGYHRSAKKCKEKFENIHKYYKKTKDGKAGRQDGKSYRFFSELEALYGGQQQQQQQHISSSTVPQAPPHDSVTSSDHRTAGNAATTTTLQQFARTGSTVMTELSASGVTLTDSSEDDYDVPAAAGGQQQQGENHHDLSKKKRKRLDHHGKLLSSSSSKKHMSVESLVKKLMDKQEAMQRKFLEAMERREQDRMVREEAFKRQEMARVTRDHELRAQEQALTASRDAALVAFLQKVTGQTLQLPQIPPPQEITAQADQKDGSGSSLDPKRWPKPEVNDLIRLRSSMETRFQEAGPKGPLWEEISGDMSRLGYNRNDKRCKEKWENINKYFRKTKESNKKRPENAKTCPYFHQLDTLYRQGVLSTPSITKGNKLAAAAAAAGQTTISEHDSDAGHELLDHHPITASLAAEHDINAQQSDADDQAQILSMLPAAAAPASDQGGIDTAITGRKNGSVSTAADQAVQFFSSPDNGSSADQPQTSKKSGMQITPR